MAIMQVLLLFVGFAMLVKGADWFVDGCSGIAGRMGIPQIVIGLTIVAMGTSAPEAAVSITAALKGNGDISVGNVLGSNIFNILFILGTSALIVPITYASGFWMDGIVAVLTGVLLWLLVLRKRELKRSGGILMLLAYGVYFGLLLW